MKYVQGTIRGYLKDLAAKLPAPGGGSSAALSLAVACSLIAMACRFTLGKEKYKKVQARMKEILGRSLKLQQKAGRLLDEDVKAYRSKNLDRSIRVPAEICFLSCQAMEYGTEVLEKGNKYLVSDALLAVLLAQVSFSAGLMYVEINLKNAKDKAKKYAKLYKSLQKLFPKTQKIVRKVEVYFGDLTRR